MSVVLGFSKEHGGEIILSDEARRQGMYVIGTTGTGKTTLLQSIAYQDMQAGDGLCVIDPHGDMIDELLLSVPVHRKDDVIVFAPADDDQTERPLGLNLLDCDRSDARQRRRVASTILDTLYKLFSYSWGPRMEDLLRNSLLALLEKDDTTFLHLWLLLASEPHRERYTADLKDPYLQQFWTSQYPRMTKSSRDEVELVGSSLNKISRFLADPLLRRIVSQRESAFDLRKIMDEGKILLVNLSKGFLGEDNAALLGAVLVNQVLIAALQRRSTPRNKRRQFHLIVDEFQNFATSAFPTLQSEARKYAIDVIVAHQFRDQLDELNQGSTLNVANFVVLRVSGRDSFELASQFDNTPPEEPTEQKPMYYEGEDISVQARTLGTDTPMYRNVEAKRRAYSDMQAETANILSTLHNYEAFCRLIVKGKTADGLIATLPFDTQQNPGIVSDIRRNSTKLGRDWREIDRDIEQEIQDVEFNLPPGVVIPSDDPRDEIDD